MTVRRSTFGFFLLAVTLLLSAPPLLAQGARDSLIAGRHAYERAELGAATRLLQVGLAGSPIDTVWAGGAHMLTDALFEQGRDTLAQLWARWIVRTAPAMRVDSTNYPPRVARAFAAARAVVGPSDSNVTSTLEPAGDPSSPRGTLRLPRAPSSLIVVVESVGTMIAGESRSLPGGSYTLRVSGAGPGTVIAAREVLPGFATVVGVRARAVAASTSGAAGPARPAGSGTTGTSGTASGRAAAPMVSLDAGGGTTCSLLEGGTAVCWGDNRAGQLGTGTADSTHFASRVAGRLAFQSISVGPNHACALAQSKVWCWGSGINGELGNGRTTSSAVPVAVDSMPQVIAVAVGASQSCALTQSGAAYCWGSNHNGELGNGSDQQSARPVVVAAPADVNFTTLAVSGSHACALAGNNTTWCWGENSSGQLGNNSTNDADHPVQVQSPVPFKALALGATHSCGLTTAGAAWCWGANTLGQLGQGAGAQLQGKTPAPLADSLVFAALAAGEAHTCGLTPDGAVYCWGSGRSGQLGNGQQNDSPRPVLVVGGQVFRAIGLGTAHSCGQAAGGAIWCWGDDGAGQLGSLGGRGSPVPVPVLERPPSHAQAAGGRPPAVVAETFDDGNWTAAPAWIPDYSPGVSMAIAQRFFEMMRAGSRLSGPGAGLSLPVHVPVRPNTQIQFDVMVLPDSLRQGCGLNCASWPAAVRLRVKNTDLTESEVWYVYGDKGGQSRSFRSAVIVAKGDAEPGHWYREERFTIRSALPRADTILEIAIGSVGDEVGARFDNIYLPVPIPSTVVLTPDNATFAAPGAHAQLRAAVFDSAGTPTPWVRVAWSSSDTAVARVDTTGQVTAVSAGHAVIRALAGGTIKDSATVTVAAGRRRSPPRRRN